MHPLILTLLSLAVISLISLIGIFSFLLKPKTLEKTTFILVAFAAGSLLGAAFLDLIPEAIELGAKNIFLYVLSGIVVFYILERVIFWHHCHKGKCDVHTFTYMNIIGDAMHNLIDGAIIAASFLANIPLGIITSIAVMFHEIPQEIGEFGILVYGGFSRKKALSFNFISSLTSFIGAMVVFLFSLKASSTISFLIPFAAGGFVYIASSDLIPELHKEKDFKKSLMQMLLFFVGIATIWVAGRMFGN